jgi:hypothetical protein
VPADDLVRNIEEESEPMRLYLLAALLVAIAPTASFAANLDDQTTAYYLTEAKDSPSGLGLTTTAGMDKGFAPTAFVSEKPLTFYAAPITGDIAGGTWVMNLWTTRLKSLASVKVEVLKTDAKGGQETVIGTSESALRATPHHHALYTVNVKVGATSLKNERLALRLTLTGGDVITIGFNANDYDSNLVIVGPKPSTPPQDSLMTFTFRNCTNKYKDSEIYYTFGGGNWVSLDKGLVIPVGEKHSARMYIALGGKPTGPGDHTHPQDFLEYNLDKSGMYVNTSQVDALVIPFTIELVDVSGRSEKMGFSESMPNMLAAFKKDAPEAFQRCIKGNLINQPPDGPGVIQTNSPDICAGVNRGVDPNSADARNPDKWYLTMPYNWYSKFMHIHSINDFAYGFAYDDVHAQSSFIVSNRPLTMIIGIYYNDAPDAKPLPATPEPPKELHALGAPKVCDVVVTDITCTPENPKAGDKVVLNAVVKNIGTAPTPEGVVIGVAFTVDGKIVAWSDAVKTALAPGASVTCTANGGPGWTAAPGKHAVMADVDNIDRFPELNEENNRLDKSITIGAQ